MVFQPVFEHLSDQWRTEGRSLKEVGGCGVGGGRAAQLVIDEEFRERRRQLGTGEDRQWSRGKPRRETMNLICATFTSISDVWKFHYCGQLYSPTCRPELQRCSRPIERAQVTLSVLGVSHRVCLVPVFQPGEK